MAFLICLLKLLPEYDFDMDTFKDDNNDKRENVFFKVFLLNIRTLQYFIW